MKRAMRKFFSHRQSTEPSRSKNDWIGEFHPDKSGQVVVTF
ncbi:hypothetical protein [Natronoflexus pectinivorans]|uniref:Uncharacterized protein n=1 Tax=Natronoflexus pectinivorans TaxID=682526 RepID=A0A4R2G9V9_9BACT|nr:hypothetical protein [Natronoflexus pectinivorans]TCO04059.1 hypothetical protein EV194_11949 [Natronoflexus pectinivorans]